MRLLCLNAGSTSVKAAVYDLVAGQTEPIPLRRFSGTDCQTSHFWMRIGPTCDAVAHRIVHGGPDLVGPIEIDDKLRTRLEGTRSLAPIHQMPALRLLDRAVKEYPAARQFACFDTDFFRDLPAIATTLPVSEEMREAGVRRYGFHGLSAESALHAFPELRDGNTVLCHLGGGTSVIGIRDGAAVSTSMGLTPNSGPPMATRCGDLDPGIVTYLVDHVGWSLDEVMRQLHHQSGLFGLTGGLKSVKQSIEAIDVAKRDQRDSSQLRRALDLYCERIAEQVAAAAVRLGGIDHLAFSGGVGENAPTIRAAILKRLRKANLLLTCRSEELVAPCDEEAVMARHLAAILPRTQLSKPSRQTERTSCEPAPS